MELDPNGSTAEAEPTHPARRSYWVMRLVRTTIMYGGYLTPKLYAPKEVWTQVRLLVVAEKSMWLMFDVRRVECSVFVGVRNIQCSMRCS